MRLGSALTLTPIGGLIDDDRTSGPGRGDGARAASPGDGSGEGGLGDRGGVLARSAAAMEALGFDSLWVFDAVGRGFLLPDPLMALTAAAGATDRVELGTGIMQLPIRNVVEVAHRVLTLELVAPGRVLFGVGPGSTERDFEVFGGSFAGRFATFEAQWRELQALVRDGSVDGRDLSPPATVLGGPTLMLAGWRGRWVERAATESSGWIASAMYADDDQLADGIERYRAAGGERAIVTNVQVGDELTPAIERLGRLADMGFDDAVVFDLTPSRDRLAALRESVDD